MVAATGRARAAASGVGLPWPAEPMLAKPTDHLPVEREMPGGSSYEPKWDGYRALLGVDADGYASIRSRRGADITRSFPDVAGPAAEQLAPGTLLDGELVVWGGEELDFSQLQRRIASPARAASLARARPATFMAFDILSLAGVDLTDEQLRIRRRRLQSLAPGLAPPLQVTPATRDRAVAQTWLREYAEAAVGIEGLVIKGLGTRYHPGTRGWLKLRTTETAEVIVGAIAGTVRAPERLVLGRYDAAGELVVVGGTSDLKPGQQREVGALLEPMTGQHPWPADVPMGGAGGWTRERARPLTRVNPMLVVEIEAGSAYADQHWRHIVKFIRPRPDLTPEEIDLA
jgi:ATP-dependent DNA ligase